MQTRREATREATIREIKQTALARMRSEGTVDVKLSDVARDMRMSAPGLYRYFDGREGLLLALITDSVTDLAERAEAAREKVAADDAGGQFLAVARAYREWALADREGFTLVFGPTMAGFHKSLNDAETAPETPDKAAALRAMDALRGLTRVADAAGNRRPPVFGTLPPVLEQAFRKDDPHHGAEPATELAMVYAWASLHGFVTLEAHGNLQWHGDDCREAMFLGHVRMLSGILGLPAPATGWPEGTPAP
jgi:AcrR family transcriptional regulator